jgi:hypothetical protein
VSREPARSAEPTGKPRSTGPWEPTRSPRSPEKVSTRFPDKGGRPDEGRPTIRRNTAIRDAVLARFPELTRTVRRSPRAPEPYSAPEPDYIPDAARAGLALGGCLIRAVLLVVFFLITLFFGALFLGGSLLQGTGIYVF